jgi:hypothetical protein
MTEISHSFVDYLQFPIISTVFLLRLSFLEKKARGCQEFCTHFCSMAPMVDVEAFVIRANRADELGCANRVAHERLTLHFLKAVLSSGVQLMG